MKPISLATLLCVLLVQIMTCGANSVSGRDTNFVIALNQKAWKVKNSDLELARHYAREAIGVAKTLHYPRGLSYSYNVLGHYYKEKDNYDSSSFYYQESLTIRRKLADTLNIVRSLRNVLSIQEQRGNLKQAIFTGLEALQLIGPIERLEAVRGEKASLMNNLGWLYSKTGDFEKAVFYISGAKKISIELSDEEGLAAASMNLGNIYESQKLYGKAILELKFAIQTFEEVNDQAELARAYNNLGDVYYSMQDFEKALLNYQQSFTIRSKEGLTGDLKNSLLNLGFVYDAMGKSDSALHYYEMGFNSSSNSGNLEVKMESLRALGAFLHEHNHHDKALSYLLQAEQLSVNTLNLPERMEVLQELSKIYDAVGKPDSAFFYSELHAALSDSLSEKLRNSMELGYELELSGEKNKQQGLVILVMAMAVIFLLIIFFLYIRSVRSRKSMQELKELLKDKELKALDAMLEGQQEERKRLATELHDTIGSMLSATKYSFKALEKSFEKILEENKLQYRKINTMLDETMDSVRRISHNMAAGIFTDKGLEGALSKLCSTFEQPGKMQVHLSVYGFDLPQEYNTK